MAAISGGRVIFKGHTKTGNIWKIWDDNALEIESENAPF